MSTEIRESSLDIKINCCHPLKQFVSRNVTAFWRQSVGNVDCRKSGRGLWIGKTLRAFKVTNLV